MTTTRSATDAIEDVLNQHVCTYLGAGTNGTFWPHACTCRRWKADLYSGTFNQHLARELTAAGVVIQPGEPA